LRDVCAIAPSLSNIKNALGIMMKGARCVAGGSGVMAAQKGPSPGFSHSSSRWNDEVQRASASAISLRLFSMP
jgi:hypothetical protein